MADSHFLIASYNRRILATRENFVSALESIHSFLEANSLTKTEIYALDVGLEEHITNLIHHGPSDPPQMEIQIHIKPQTISMILKDSGEPFDPTNHNEPPHLNATLEERPVGGLGIHLIRNLFHKINYQYSQGYNHLELQLNRTEVA